MHTLDADIARIADLIARRRRLTGWSVRRLHINQPSGERGHARIGWRTPYGCCGRPESRGPVDGHAQVTRHEWEAVDDDVIELSGPWSDDAMRALCRRVGSRGYERQTGADHVAWLADLPLADTQN